MKLASKLFASVLAFAVAAPVLAADKPAGDKPADKKPAAGATADKPKAKGLKGAVVKVDGTNLVIKNKEGKETTVSTNNETKVTIDGKDAKLADLKADQMVTVSPAEGTAQTIVVAAPKAKK